MAVKDKKGIKSRTISSRLLYFILGVVVFVLYFNTTRNDYVLDDYSTIVNHKYVQKGVSGIGDILTTNNLDGFNNYNDGLYRPVSLISFAVEKEIFGKSPAAGHWINLFLYMGLMMLLFKLLTSIFHQRGILFSFLVAVLFAAHPLHTEVVANIKSRDEILSLLFMIFAFMAIIKYYKRGTILQLVLGVLMYALSFLSKESAVTYIALVPLILFFFYELKRKELIISSLLLILTSGILLLIRYRVINSMGPVDEGYFSVINNSLFGTDDFLVRVATGIYLQLLYILKLIIPWPLSHDYSFNQIALVGFANWQVYLALVVLAAISFFAVKGLKKRSIYSFSILFYAITISIYANIVILIGATFAERFLFTPSLALCIILVALIQRVGSKDLKPLLSFSDIKTIPAIVLVVLFLGYGIITIQRNSDWKDNLSLYSADIDKVPNSARANYNFGTEVYNRAVSEGNQGNRSGLTKKAIAHLSKAVSILPDYVMALNNLGNAYSLDGNLDSAMIFFKRAIDVMPEYQNAYFNLGYNQWRNKEYKDAITNLETYLTYNTTNANAYYYIANSAGFLSDFTKAIENLTKCLELDPANFGALMDLGKAYGIQGDHVKALAIFEKALLYQPNNAELVFYTGIAASSSGELEKAVKYLEQAINLEPRNSAACKELIRIYSETGNQAGVDKYTLILSEM